ncbi:MAG: hypothetical protein UY96_C0013G0012 [Parcubacteria group bacterium GW2011_GWB1_56_8]|nr:MAG: hypothetical protein UY96_C0013G0012 [Parcubacteria group bacterium GW2011_GWB1_56_8]
MARKVTDVVNLGALAKLFGISMWDDFNEGWEPGAHHYAYQERHQEAIDDGESEDRAVELAEEAAMKAEEEEQAEFFSNYHHCLFQAVESEFEKHGLELIPKHSGEKYPYEFVVVPLKSWEDAAVAIMGTINGVGMFWFHNLKEFLKSGPYTPREAVLLHLDSIKVRAEVYGDASAKRTFERCMRF